jgi:hypothetical protein
MSDVEFERVEASLARHEIVDFFFRHRRWPVETRDEYFAIWDWRQRALSDGPAFAYVARLKSTGEMVGHVGIYRRRFRIGNEIIQACVPGNLFVHPEWKGIVGVRLVMFFRSVIQDREFDLFLGFGNDLANTMLARLGFAQFGSMHTYVDVLDAAAVLHRRSRTLAPVAPLVNLGFAARRRWKRVRTSKTHLQVRRLAATDFETLDRGHWAPSPTMVAWDSNRFIVERYLNEPSAERVLFGLFHPVSESFEGFTAVETGARLKVWDCQTNSAMIDPVDAIQTVCETIPGAETILAPTLPQSVLARRFKSAGYLDRESVDTIETNTFVSALSLPDSPHADLFRDPARWSIWIGSRHY